MKKRISDLLTVLMSLIAYVILSPNFSFVAFADGGTEFNPGWPFATKGYDHYIRVVDNYSPSYSLKEHKGMDIAADIGDEVLAVESGKVVAVVNNKADAYESGSWGNYVKIEHTINGKKYYSLYAHLKKGSVTVNTNDNVKKGDVIGLVGISGASTGPHLHLEMNTGKRWTQSFEYYKDSSAINGVWFNSNSRNYSKHYSQWIKDNCEQIKRGKTTFYVYNGGKVNEPVDPKPDNLNPEISFENRNMIVDVGKGYTLRICSTVNHNKEYAIGSIPNEATVYVYGTTNQQYDNRTWAKISYNGTDGWVNYEYLRPISSPPTPTLIKEYSITFDANGGTGMMAEADMICGVPKSLPANSFYRDGYRFAGWAGSPNGQVEFSDQQMVDLSSVGGVCIGLYAIWEPNFEKPVLSISEHNTPPDQETGDNFGIRGVIQTNCGKITQVRGYILDSGNNPIQTGEYMPNAESIDLRYSINNDLVFGRLPAGSYTYCVEATAVNGDQTTTETLINSSFRVKEKNPYLHSGPNCGIIWSELPSMRCSNVKF
ncbi:MAG: peptidoglycan DD-metalloendopeptidase family protein [Oscillospiraceae bacterium]|nr:peptidoglycan DD-metalloendopeptidase family protein [Oscillospiraceae bacterium]